MAARRVIVMRPFVGDRAGNPDRVCARPPFLQRQRLKQNRFCVVYGMAEQSAEKLKALSFRGTFYAEESLILFTLNPREIPRFARNDTKRYFFRSL